MNRLWKMSIPTKAKNEILRLYARYCTEHDVKFNVSSLQFESLYLKTDDEGAVVGFVTFEQTTSKIIIQQCAGDIGSSLGAFAKSLPLHTLINASIVPTAMKYYSEVGFTVNKSKLASNNNATIPMSLVVSDTELDLERIKSDNEKIVAKHTRPKETLTNTDKVQLAKTLKKTTPYSNNQISATIDHVSRHLSSNGGDISAMVNGLLAKGSPSKGGRRQIVD